MPGVPDDSRTLILEVDDPDGLDEERFRQGLLGMTGLEWGASAESYEIVLTVARIARDSIVAGAAWGFAPRAARPRVTASP